MKTGRPSSQRQGPRSGLVLLAGLAFLSIGRAGAAPALPGGRLLPGSWLSVEGHFNGEGVLLARQIESTDERRPTLKGILDAYDARRGLIVFGPIRLALDDSTRIEDESGAPLTRADLRPGVRVKVVLQTDPGGAPRVRRVRRLGGDSPVRRIEAPVEWLADRGPTVQFRLLGVDVHADPKTHWVGIPGPLSTVDDEDVRLGGVRLGRLGVLTGEFRFDYQTRENFDLTDQLDRDVASRRYRTELELTFPTSRHVSGMAGLKAFDEEAVVDEADTFTDRQQITLGPTYLLFSGILSRHGSLQVGRSRFDDDRDWLFRRDLDALRFLFDFQRMHLEVSVSEEIATPEGERQKDIRNTLLFASFFPGGGSVLSAYVFDRRDRFREPDGDPRDFSPRCFGLRAYGEGEKVWSYWLEAALVRGRIEGERLAGRALDVGGSLTFPAPWEPTLTLGYALGSGDDDPFDGVSRTFRQTGLQLNNGKWNGVTNFRYYGQVLRPELANLRIETYGAGIRPRKKTSFDLVYHRYRLDRPASRLVGGSIRDRRLNLLDLDVGREWDLVIGFEQIHHLEFELDLGLFLAGKAFLGEVDQATSIAFKAKYVF